MTPDMRERLRQGDSQPRQRLVLKLKPAKAATEPIAPWEVAAVMFIAAMFLGAWLLHLLFG